MEWKHDRLKDNGYRDRYQAEAGDLYAVIFGRSGDDPVEFVVATDKAILTKQTSTSVQTAKRLAERFIQSSQPAAA